MLLKRQSSKDYLYGFDFITMRTILQLLFLLGFQLSFAQSNTLYNKYVSQADSLYKEGEYKAAAQAYYRGFLTIDGKAFHNDRYNAACSYSMAKMNDSAFYHLNYMVEKSSDYLYDSYQHVSEKDGDLANIRKDKRWEAFQSKMDSIKTEKEKDLDMVLVEQLNEIHEKDQGIRYEYFDLREKYERDSDTMKAFYKHWREVDSINEAAVCMILDERGWLGADVVGNKGNSALFLVIQHAPLETQEKYLPMMREAVKNGNAKASSLALLEDRVNLRNNRHQIYGSQIGKDPNSEAQIVLPLIDPDKVDERRAEMGLGPLGEYTQRFGFEWDVELYKKQLPEIEKFYFNKDSE